MSNTPSDDVLFELIKEHFDLDKRPFDTVIDLKTGRFQDAARYRDFASAVLARWGSPQPVVREPLTDEHIRAMLNKHPPEDVCGWSYRMGIDDAELHHGIKGGQHEPKQMD